MKFDFFWHFSPNTQNIRFNEIRPVGTEVFHADRQTDMIKLYINYQLDALIIIYS